MDVLECGEQIALLFMDKCLAIRDQELHIADLCAIDGRMVDLVEHAVRAGEPHPTRCRVGCANCIFYARGPARLEAGRAKCLSLLVEPAVQGLITHAFSP